MADQLQLRGGTTAEHATFTGALREVTVDTDKDTVVVHDNATPGGHPLAKENLSNVSAATAATKLDGQTVKFGLGAAATPSVTFNGDLNTGVYSPGADQVAISTGGSQRLLIDSYGIVTPGGGVFSGGVSSYAVNGLVLNFSSPFSEIRACRAGGNYGGLKFYTQGANSSGAQAERMTITTEGLVGIGTSTVNSKLAVSNNGAESFEFYPADASNVNKINYYNRSGAVYCDAVQNAASHQFAIQGTEKARLDSSGRLLVGTSSTSSNTSILAQGNSGGTAGNLRLASTAATPGSGDDLGNLVFTDSTHGSCALITGARDGGTWSVSSKPTRLVFSTTADGASSPTERMRINAAGAVGIGKTPDFNPATNGFEVDSGAVIATRAGAAILFINRNTDDGTLVSFRQAATEEGSISVSGTTVSYNGAHLSRWSQIPSIDPYDKTVRPEILRGTVMSNLDEMCDWVCPTSGDCQDNEQLNKTKISDVEGDKNVAGVFQSWDDDDDTWVNDYYLAMTGDFVIRIAAGVTVERGDLLMSAGDGTAKPQDDDIIRSKTIAKVTSTNVSCTYEDGSYCVPCVLMAC